MAFANRFAILPTSDSEEERPTPVVTKPVENVEDKQVKGKKTQAEPKKSQESKDAPTSGRGGRGRGRGRGKNGAEEDENRPPRQRKERGERGERGGRGRGRGRAAGGEAPENKETKSTEEAWGVEPKPAAPKEVQAPEPEEEEEEDLTLTLVEYQRQQATLKAALNAKLSKATPASAEEAQEETAAPAEVETKKKGGKKNDEAKLVEQLFRNAPVSRGEGRDEGRSERGGRGRGRGGRGGRGGNSGPREKREATNAPGLEIDESAFPALG